MAREAGKEHASRTVVVVVALTIVCSIEHRGTVSSSLFLIVNGIFLCGRRRGRDLVIFIGVSAVVGFHGLMLILGGAWMNAIFFAPSQINCGKICGKERRPSAPAHGRRNAEKVLGLLRVRKGMPLTHLYGAHKLARGEAASNGTAHRLLELRRRATDA